MLGCLAAPPRTPAALWRTASREGPLAVGLVAFGAGLLIAGLMPATRVEAQGAQRLKDVAQEHGQPVMDQAKVGGPGGRRAAEGKGHPGGGRGQAQRTGVSRAREGRGADWLL